MIRLYVEGVGLAGPGLDGWEASRSVLTGDRGYVPAALMLPAPRGLPPAEARRTGYPVRLAMAVAEEAVAGSGRDAASLATIFTSSSGDGDNVHEILEILATPLRELSPTRFHNSVHNAAAGYWSIASRSHEPSTSLCGYDASFAAGLLETASQVAVSGEPVALIAYDHPYPEPLHAKRPLSASFGAALVCALVRTDRTLASLEIATELGSGTQETTLSDPVLEALRRNIPAARALPLLATLACGSAARVTLAYLGASLDIKVGPCR